MAGKDWVVEGEIVFDDTDIDVNEATAYVRLRDVSRADRPASTVAKQILKGVSTAKEKMNSLRFSLLVPASEVRASYSLHVLVDVDGDGRASRGDFVTKQSYPVPPGHGTHVVTHVRQIR